MSLHRAAFAIAFATLTSACAAQSPRSDPGRSPAPTFHLVNATFDSITALAIAPAGSDDFQVVDLSHPLQGGLGSITFQVPDGGCLRDLRITFRGGRVMHLDPVDMCRTDGVRLDAK